MTSLSISLTQKVSSGRDRSLSSIAGNMIYFLQNNKDPETILYDEVNGEGQIPAKDYFKSGEKLYLVKPKFLPFDAYIKAAFIQKKGADKDRPIIQTGVLDFKKLEELVLNSEINLEGKTFLYRGKKVIETLTGARRSKERTSRRTDIKLFSDYNSESQEAAYNVLDIIEANNLFTEDPFIEGKLEEINVSSSGQMKPELQLKQEMQQLIQMEQRPLLMMTQTVYQAQQARLLNMTQEEINNLTSETRADLEREAFPILRKMAIQKIKDVSLKKISWKEATTIYNNLSKKL